MSPLHQRHARAFTLVSCVVGLMIVGLNVQAEVEANRGAGDPRIRVAIYKVEEVYRLRGFVGFQIDLEFEAGESFLGLAAGDIEGLSFVAQDNHLFLKPKAATVGTNLTVLTTRRHYQFYYTARERRPAASEPDVVYALRFEYPPVPASSSAAAAKRVEDELVRGANARARNVDYWYCGHESLRPIAASDDGVHTRLRFGALAELPAIFVRGEDGSESLLNFSIEEGEVVVHRVARKFVLRRGSLTGCVVNKGFVGSGESLDSGTVAPGVQRERKGSGP